MFHLPKASAEIGGRILGFSGGAASDLQGHLGHREIHHFCKALSTGEPQTLTLCNSCGASVGLYGVILST